jgi:hypothetical protein
MFHKLVLTALVASGLALAGLSDTASADHNHRRSGGFRGGYYGDSCRYGGYGYGNGFYGSPYYGGHRHYGGYSQPSYGGFGRYGGSGYGGSGLYIQGRNFGFGFSRW